MTLVEKLVAIEKTQGVKVDFLGYLLWYTITDCKITRNDLETVFNHAGLDLKYLPKPISPRDAFRRASKRGELKRYPIDKDRYLNLLVREVSQDAKTVVHQIVREVVDSKNVRLEYTPIAQLKLEAGTLNVSILSNIEATERCAITAIQDAYEIERDHYNGQTIRNIIVDILNTCKPVAVRPSGGVYFVPEQYNDTLEALKRFVNELAPWAVGNRRPRFWTVPVVDAAEEREMLGESLEEDIASESARLIDEMTKILKGSRTITPLVTQQYAERIKALAEKVRTYEDMLDTKLVAAKSNLDLVRQQALLLMERVSENA